MAHWHTHPEPESCPQCEFAPFVHNHFFTGKMMGAGEFDAETRYHAEKLRHHNVRLHGWGVVCGLAVHQHPSPDCRRRYVIVEPGSALDCCGREILLPQREIVGIAQHPAVRKVAGDGQLHTLQLAICARDCPTEEVPVLYDECGCDDTQCAPNRILESFAFDVLVDPPLAAAASSAALAAIVATDLHGAGGALRADAAGKLALVEPGNAARAIVADPLHGSLVAIALPAAARAIALAPDGLRFFVVTAPLAATECEVHVYQVADGAEVATTVPGVVRTVPGSSATSTISAAATGAAASALLVLEAASGQLFRFAADATHGIEDSHDGAPITLPAGSDALAALEDGSLACAVDNHVRVQAIDLASPASSVLGGLPSSARPVAVAPFLLGTTPMVAVASASGSEKRIYLIDSAAGTLEASIDLPHTPRYLAATGGAGAPWLTVYEEDAGHAWAQAIGPGPLATGAAPAVAAPRALGPGVRHVVLIGAGGQAATLDATTLADSTCADLLRHQLHGCGGCETAECVVLATLANLAADMALLDLPGLTDDLEKGIVRIDNLAGRRLLASTWTLQKWLECLQLKGGVPGPPGKDGDDGDDGDAGAPGVIDVRLHVGGCATTPALELEDGVLALTLPKCCDGELAHICRINWVHGGSIPAGSGIVEIAFDNDLFSADLTEENLIQAFVVETQDRHLVQDQTGVNFLVECWCQVVGKYESLRLDRPCDPDGRPVDGAPNTLRFIPEPPLRPRRTYRVRLHGDLLRDARSERAVDANHLPPWVSGGRPSGDCIEGGTFLSWFTAA